MKWLLAVFAILSAVATKLEKALNVDGTTINVTWGVFGIFLLLAVVQAVRDHRRKAGEPDGKDPRFEHGKLGLS